MKKYTQPELSVSMFDIEDVITASGAATTLGAIAVDLGGQLYKGVVGEGVVVENTDATAAAYFNWK